MPIPVNHCNFLNHFQLFSLAQLCLWHLICFSYLLIITHYSFILIIPIMLITLTPIIIFYYSSMPFILIILYLKMLPAGTKQGMSWCIKTKSSWLAQNRSFSLWTPYQSCSLPLYKPKQLEEHQCCSPAQVKEDFVGKQGKQLLVQALRNVCNSWNRSGIIITHHYSWSFLISVRHYVEKLFCGHHKKYFLIITIF